MHTKPKQEICCIHNQRLWSASYTVHELCGPKGSEFYAKTARGVFHKQRGPCVQTDLGGDCCPHWGESILWAHAIEGVSNYHVQAGVGLGKAGFWWNLMADRAPLRWWAKEQLPMGWASFLMPALPLQWLWVLAGHCDCPCACLPRALQSTALGS